MLSLNRVTFPSLHQVNIFRDAAVIMCDFVKMIRAEGFQLQYLNIGGGLGIDYSHDGEVRRTSNTLIKFQPYSIINYMFLLCFIGLGIEYWHCGEVRLGTV